MTTKIRYSKRTRCKDNVSAAGRITWSVVFCAFIAPPQIGSGILQYSAGLHASFSGRRFHRRATGMPPPGSWSREHEQIRKILMKMPPSIRCQTLRVRLSPRLDNFYEKIGVKTFGLLYPTACRLQVPK